MKRIIQFTLLTCAALMMPALSTAKKPKKKDTPVVKKDATKADYNKITKDAVCQKGMFITWQSKKTNKLYFEIPEEAFKHSYLLSNRMNKTSNTHDFVAGQMITSPMILRLSKDNQKVYFHTVQHNDYVKEGDAIETSFKKNFIDPVLKGFKIVAKNGNNVVIEVTSFFGGNEKCISPLKQESPLAKLFGGGKAIKGSFQKDGSNILSVKTFPKNVEIKSLLSFTTRPLNRPYSVWVHRSLLVLPDTPMKMRMQDNRVGFFSSDKNLFTSSKDRVVPQTFIHRWRLEPKAEDVEKYFKGELVEPQKQIVFYVDPAFPAKWRETVKKGIEEWNAAFEVAGFKNVVKALDYPKNDPDFDPDDMRYNCVKYALTTTANAMGPSFIDPRSGEILTADVIWYHNVVSLLHNWRFVQTGAVDPRVRKPVFDNDVMSESIHYAISHEIGHTLGLMHNMGASYSYPIDSLRSPSFTQKYGTTPSIMDYARNNFIAQPGDYERGVKLTPPRLGVYDIFAINWGYRLIKEAKTPEEEVAKLNQWIESKKDDKMYEFGAQQIFGTVDPTAQTEDLSNDHMKAGDLAINNLKIIMKNLEKWTYQPGQRYDEVEKMYREVVYQYRRHLYHVMPYIGGIHFKEIRQGDQQKAKNYIDKATQRKAMKWLINQARTYNNWLTPKELLAKFEEYMNVNDKLQKAVVAKLFNSSALYRIKEGGIVDAKNNYTLAGYLNDVIKELFKATYQGKALTEAERNIQTAAIDYMIKGSGLSKNTKKKTKSFNSYYEDMLQEEKAHQLPCQHMNSCSCQHEHSFIRINFGLPTLKSSENAMLMTAKLKQILKLYKTRRYSAKGLDREFYDYQIIRINRLFNNQ